MSARAMTRRPLGLALALSLLWAGAAGAAGAASAHRAAGVARRAAGAASAQRAHARKPVPPRVTAASVLAGLLRSGAIQQSTYDSYRSIYAHATGSLRKLSGTRRSELAAVLANVEAMARAGQLTASRLPVVFLTLQRNWEWWTVKPLLAGGQRVSFPPSRLVWEHYSGQGIEIQWLATFGQANGYYLSGDTSALLGTLAEAISLASQRAGGIAWEYLFRFDGGSPPWTSALSQGTALQALARAWSATHEERFLSASRQALGIFRAAPPAGVLAPAGRPGAGASSTRASSRAVNRTRTSGIRAAANRMRIVGTSAADTGAWYLQYSYDPAEHVINGFIQALVGLYDYAELTGDPLGQQLFEAGDTQARAQLPHFDTGAWSKYDQRSESDLSYHDLLTEFLEHLCERARAGEPLAAGAGQIPGDQIYCSTASRFRQDLKTPPAVQLLTSSVNAGGRAGVQIKLSKVSTVDMTITLGEGTVWHNRATVEGGTPRLLWVTPSKPGAYGVVLRARDLAGNEEVASGSITVKAPSKPAGARRGKRHGNSGRAGGASRGRAASAQAPAPISPPARRLPAL